MQINVQRAKAITRQLTEGVSVLLENVGLTWPQFKRLAVPVTFGLIAPLRRRRSMMAEARFAGWRSDRPGRRGSTQRLAG